MHITSLPKMLANPLKTAYSIAKYGAKGLNNII